LIIFKVYIILINL